MNSFEQAKGVEERSLKILRPLIKQRAFNGQFVITSKGPLARELQLTIGDLLYNSDANTVYAVEIKAEQSNRHKNFFLETWSNLSRFTPGWMINLKTDLLLYHFIDDDELWVIPFEKLRIWAFRKQEIYKHPLLEQKKYKQMNDTWGHVVPILHLKEALNLSIPYAPIRDSALNSNDWSDDF